MKSTQEDKNRGLATLWETLVNIFSLSKPYRLRFYSATMFVIVASAIWLSVPLGLRELLDAVFEQGDGRLLNMLALGLMALFVVQAAFSFAGNYHLEWVGERVITDLRRKCMNICTVLDFDFLLNAGWEKSPQD